MKVERIDLYHVRLPLRFGFETSFGRSEVHEAIIVRVEGEGGTGWGEAPTGAGPFYSHEDADTAWHVLRDFLIPALRKTPIESPSELVELFRFVRGHPMAKAGIEAAMWDLEAKRRGISLARLYRGEPAPEMISTGISLGLEPRIEILIERVERAVRAGYRRIKLKIMPGRDVEVVRAVRERFREIPLMVDANAAYTLNDVETLRRLDEFDLMMIEQPLSHDDLLDHAELQKRIKTPICLDESIKTPEHAEHAARIGACRVVNIKQARVGGPTQARRLHDKCRSHGLPVWCGGLLETGIGRLHNIALSTLPGFVLPGDISASDRYYEEDLIDPPVVLQPGGTLRVPRGPGIGHSVNESRLRALTLRHVGWS